MVVEYISGIKTAIDIAKALKTATDSLDNAQIKLQMAELISSLADAKLEAAESSETIKKLRARLEAKETLMYESGLYYRISDNDSRDGPFCPTCYDSESKDIRLRQARGDSYNWRCNICQNTF